MKIQVIQGGGKPRELSQNDLEWAEYLSYEAEQEKDDRNRRLLKYLADHILGRPELILIKSPATSDSP